MGNIYFLYWLCRLSRHVLDWPLPFVFRQFGTSPKWPWDSSAPTKNWCRSVRTLRHQLFGAEVSWLVPKCPGTITVLPAIHTFIHKCKEPSCLYCSISPHFGQFSFPVPQRVGGWVDLGGWSPACTNQLIVQQPGIELNPWVASLMP